MYRFEWPVSENGKNTTDFFSQKSKLKLFHERTHSKRAVKYINMTKPRARKEITNSLL